MIDLHMHSHFSDGSAAPTELIREAKALDLYAVALTDHDTMAGVEAFLQAGEEAGIHAVAGVEISIDTKLPNNGHMHLLGLFIDPQAEKLMAKLDFLRQQRNMRAERILSFLNNLGIEITMSELLLEAGEGSIGRPHVANILLRKGVVSSIQEAFDKYLAKGKPAYVDKTKFEEEEAISLVRQAGGLTILAHPHLMGYDKIEETGARILELQEQGLDGCEVYYPGMPGNLSNHLMALAKSHGFLVSGGSDYHGLYKPNVAMGTGTGELSVPDQIYHELHARVAGKKPEINGPSGKITDN